MYDYLDSVIKSSWMYMHDKKATYCDKHVSSRKCIFCSDSYWYIPSTPRENYSLLVMESTGMMKMATGEGFPSGRVPGRVLLALPILGARRQRNRDEIAKKGSRPEGFGTRCKYMPKGGVR